MKLATPSTISHGTKPSPNLTQVNQAHMMGNYRIVGNFRGAKFSQTKQKRNFRGQNFGGWLGRSSRIQTFKNFAGKIFAHVV